MVPSRFVCASPSPAQRRLAFFLTRGDPPAEAVVDALRGLPRDQQEAAVNQMLGNSAKELTAPLASMRAQLEMMPPWFDAEVAERGGAVLLRYGLLAGLVLAFKSIVLGYCSPAGNKPLVRSGRLLTDVHQRLIETARFVEAVSRPGGLGWGQPGLAAAVRVRLMHARIRQALRHSPDWPTDDWGVPINQYDEAGTLLLFSSQLLDGLEALGVTVSEQDYEATLHLWRAVGWLMGVDAELLMASRRDARRLWESLEATQGPPDDDARRLTHALIEHGGPEGPTPGPRVDFAHALCRHLIGDRYADALYLRAGPWGLLPRVLRRVVNPLDRATRSIPLIQSQLLRVGAGYWRNTIELTIGNREVAFPLPP